MAPDPLPSRPRKPRAALLVLSVILWVVLLALVRGVPPDGREHGDFGQLLGRFHPLLIHLPIGILVLAVGVELAACRPRWAHLRPTAGWLLALAAILTYATAVDGWLLAWSGGYRGRTVTYHMWAGASLAVVAGAAAFARRERPGAAYWALLAATFGLLLVSSHLGGTLSHGEGYLTDKFPARLRTLIGLPAAARPPETGRAPAGSPGPAAAKAGLASANPANPAFYAVHIAPLFARSCISCHKPEKHKGGLRMDSYAELMRGGDDGPAVVPGDGKGSEIVRRVTLPPSDDDAMPSDGDKPLSSDEIQMLQHWIAAGAKG